MPNEYRRPLLALENQLREFHYRAGQSIGRTPAIRDARLRARLIIEEAVETALALMQSEHPEAGGGVLAGLDVHQIFDDVMKGCVSNGKLSDLGSADDRLAEVVDGCMDLIYVTVGTMVACGVPGDPFWNEIHSSNLAKMGGPIIDGKLMKPRGWRPPRVREMLDSLRPIICAELALWKPEGEE